MHYHSAEPAARAVAAEIAALGRPVQFDVAQREATAAALKGDMEAHGAYYGVVSNAGIAADETFRRAGRKNGSIIGILPISGTWRAEAPPSGRSVTNSFGLDSKQVGSKKASKQVGSKKAGKKKAGKKKAGKKKA